VGGVHSAGFEAMLPEDLPRPHTPIPSGPSWQTVPRGCRPLCTDDRWRASGAIDRGADRHITLHRVNAKELKARYRWRSDNSPYKTSSSHRYARHRLTERPKSAVSDAHIQWQILAHNASIAMRPCLGRQGHADQKKVRFLLPQPRETQEYRYRSDWRL
jgi:hypothetical protein